MPGQRKSSVTLRQDLVDMVNEIQFEDMNINGEAVAPTVGVSKRAAEYPIMPRENIMKVPDTRRQADGGYNRGQWDWDSDTYVTREYGFEQPIDNVKALEDEEFVSHEEVSAQLAYQSLLLARESRVAGLVFDQTTWNSKSKYTAVGTAWDNVAATPWADIDTHAKVIRGIIGYNKTVLSLIISDDNIDSILRSTEIKTVYQYTDYGSVLRSPLQEKARFLASYLGIKEVIPVMSMYDTSKLAAEAKIGKFWSNSYAMLGKLCGKGTNIFTQGLIKQLAWTAYSNNYIMEDYPDDEHNAHIIRAREYRGIKVNYDYGWLLGNIKGTVDAATGV